jgi:uncharacterized protein
MARTKPHSAKDRFETDTTCRLKAHKSFLGAHVPFFSRSGSPVNMLTASYQAERAMTARGAACFVTVHGFHPAVPLFAAIACRRRLDFAAIFSKTVPVKPYLLSLFLCAMSLPAFAEESVPLTRLQAMTGCDRFAADPHDRARPEGLPGVAHGLVSVKEALEICKQAAALAPDEARYAYQAGRAALLAGDKAAGRVLLEKAAASDYAAAHRALGLLAASPDIANLPSDDGAPLTLAALAPSRKPQMLRHLRIAAEKGDEAARVELGYALLSGALLYSDVTIAEALLRKAAANGEPLADVALGWFYAHGPSARRDYGQARAAFERAMDKGEPEAFRSLGEMAETGLGEIRDTDKARRLYRKAIEAGSVSAIVSMALLEEGKAADSATADRQALAKAASLGDIRALRLLADAGDPAAPSLRDLARLRDAPALLSLARKELAANAMPEASPLLDIAIALGLPEAKTAKGEWLVASGRDGEAEPLLLAAAQSGDDLGALRYAELLVRLGRQQEAEGWFQLAAYANVPGARKAMGTHYRDGTIGRKSADGARQWYRRAMEGGDETARIGMALAALDAAGQSGDYSEAKQLFRAIPDGPDFAEAQWQLGFMAMNGLGQQVDNQEALERFMAAGAKGDPRSLNMIGSLYEGDRLGEPDLTEAKIWYVKAAELNDTGAMMRLAAMASDRLPAADAGPEAVRWLEAASHLGLAEAKLALAAAHHHGIGVPKDDARALRLVRELADIGDFAGRLNLARFTELGIGEPKDLEKARELYRVLFDEASTPLAQLGLARIAEAGTPVNPADPAYALYLYSAVADTSLDDASAAVARIKLAPGPLQDDAGALVEMRKGLTSDLPKTLGLLARYACAKPDLKSDCETALRRLTEMTESGINDARPVLAGLIADGIGIVKDVKQAASMMEDEKLAVQKTLLTGQFLLIEP